ncbi:hypothetical protein Tco_0240658 [Tanacetum coccineum]
MAAISNVPKLIDKKGGSYSIVAPRLEPGKFNKWKKCMLCYLTRMEPYYIQCIKDGPFKPKTAEGDDKPKSQWTLKERRVVNQDQRLKSILISCLPYDIIESVISCEKAKATWTDLVHSFKGPSDTKENRIMDLKLEYQTFKAKSSKTLSQTYTPLQNHTHGSTSLMDLEMQITLRPLTLPISMEENYDDGADKRTSEEYLRDLDIEFHERALLANSKLLKGFQPKFTPKLIQSSQHAQSSQGEPKVQKDYKVEYKKMKAKLALLEAYPPTSQSSKPFQSKNKGLVIETFDWDEEEVSDDDNEETQVKVLMALADDEISMGKNHACNDEWIDITMKKVNILLSMDENSDWQTYLKCINIDLKDDLLALKQANLEAVTFQIQNTKLTKLKHALQDQLKEKRKVNEKWLNSSNKVSQCINEQIPNQKKKIRGGEQLNETSSSNKVKENPFIPASLDYDHEMVPKSKDWVERLNPDSKLPNFNTRIILVPESQVVNECL